MSFSRAPNLWLVCSVSSSYMCSIYSSQYLYLCSCFLNRFISSRLLFFHFVRWSFEWSFSARFKSNYTRLLTQLDWSSRNGKRYGTRTSVTWNAHYTYTLFDWFSACLFFGFHTYIHNHQMLYHFLWSFYYTIFLCCMYLLNLLLPTDHSSHHRCQLNVRREWTTHIPSSKWYAFTLIGSNWTNHTTCYNEFKWRSTFEIKWPI